jgi:hypothetical protein
VGVKLLKWNEKSETSYRRRPESEMGASFKGMNMTTKFSSNLSSAMRKDDWNVKAYGRR